jgi:hypothetical protein
LAAPPDPADWDGASEATMPGSGDRDPVGVLREGGFTTEPVGPVAAVAEPDGSDELSPVGEDGPEPEPAEAADHVEPADQAEQSAEPSPRRRGLRRSRVPA